MMLILYKTLIKVNNSNLNHPYNNKILLQLQLYLKNKQLLLIQNKLTKFKMMIVCNNKTKFKKNNKIRKIPHKLNRQPFKI